MTPNSDRGDSDLEGLDPYALMDVEANRLDGFFASVDDAGWRAPSRCEGWSVRDVLAHLTASEDYNRACLDGTVSAFLAGMGARGVTDLASANELGIRDLDDVDTPALLETWRTRASENRDGFRAREGADVDSSVGPYPARWQAFHLAAELAIHADDVGAPVEDAEAGGRTHWLAQFGRFALKEHNPELQTKASDNRTHVQGEGIDVDLADADFVAAASGRLPEDSPLDPETRRALAVT